MPALTPSPSDVLGTAAVWVARAIGLDDALLERLGPHLPLLGADRPGAGHRTPEEPDDPGPADDPGRLGRLHQSLLARDHRRRRGVHYTPGDVAGALVERVVGPVLAVPSPPPTVEERCPAPPAVCDPACGGGAFLLAAAEVLGRSGWSGPEVVAALHGLDIDPTAVEVARTSLALWAARAGAGGDDLVALAVGLAERVVVGDALRDPWPAEGRLAAVVGNPPFAGQLARDTARDASAADAARALLGAAPGYADTAGLFLVRAVDAAPGGRVGLVLPVSVLGARDAGAVRRRVEDRAVLEEVWIVGERVFGAAVDVCAPVLRCAVGLGPPAPSGSGEVAVRVGVPGREVGRIAIARLADAGTWSPVVALADGVPLLELTGGATVGDRAHATAGFRDEFYAVAPHVVDLADPSGGGAMGTVPPSLPAGHARLVTAGLVEPARTAWGERTTRMAGRRLRAPALDLRALRDRAEAGGGDRRFLAWAEARSRPKVVVATQTAVVEAAVDEDGTWWPSVPVISVVPDAEHPSVESLWLLAAALAAPPASAWVAERASGTALGARALRVSARTVARVPLPVDHDAWAEGARLLRRVPAAAPHERGQALLGAGRVLTAAHGFSGRAAAAVVGWWATRAGCAPQDAPVPPTGGQAGVASGSRSG